MEDEIDMGRDGSIDETYTAEAESAISNDDEELTKENGSNWLSRMLNFLDKSKKTEDTATHTEDADDVVSDDDREFSTPETASVPRKVLNNMEIFSNDLSEVSKLAKKSNFCTMTVAEEGWSDYKEFMYKCYRGYASKNSRRATTSVEPNEAATKGQVGS